MSPQRDDPPGAYRPTVDRHGRFTVLARQLPPGAIVLIDERVARLHPKVLEAAQRRAGELIPLQAGEGAKSLAQLERLATRTVSLPRGTPVVAIGGGTIGDLATVFAHVFKRGAPLIHVPSTLLAAVDSSIGGKGAVHAGPTRQLVKNAIGVFHYARERWICPELFQTLSEAQHREGRAEAYKMAVCLDEVVFARYQRRRPALQAMLEDARRLKDGVCEVDPYEEQGKRRVLNFGHTFGHVLESLTHFGLTHGEAVGLGMLCALDVGRVMDLTPRPLASEVEATLLRHDAALPREALKTALRRATPDAVARLLDADKKTAAPGKVRMILLLGPGATTLEEVPRDTWAPLLELWRAGGTLR